MWGIVRGIITVFGHVIELDKFSLKNGAMCSVRVRICIDLSSPLVPSACIPFRSENVWIEFKYERLPCFCYYCGEITHQTRLCLNASDFNIDFGGKYAPYGEWLRSDLNMKVFQHMKMGGLKKKGGITFGEGSYEEKKK